VLFFIVLLLVAVVAALLNILPKFKSIKNKILVSICVIIAECFVLYFVCYYFGIYYAGSYLIFLSITFIPLIIYKITKLKHAKIYISLIFVVIISIITINTVLGLKETDINKIINTTQEHIINEFTNDKDNSLIKYKNATVQITGKISYIGRPKDYTPLWDASYIDLGERDETKCETHVVCYFDKISAVDNLQKGQEISILCKFKEYSESEYGNSIVFRKSVVSK
jgi:hypothetical protein